MSRPELTGHASLFYNERESKKYDSSSRMVGIQREITHRAIELLKLDNGGPRLILDVGCGSGLSGQVRTHARVYRRHIFYYHFSFSLVCSIHEEEKKGKLMHAIYF